MRITILAPGSRGDVQPYVALGNGLANSGHTVRIVSHENFGELLTDTQLEFFPIKVDVKEIAQKIAMSRRVENGNFIALMAQMAKESKRGAIQMAKTGLAATVGADVLIGGIGGLISGSSLAEKLNIPFIHAYLTPLTQTTAFPSPLAPSAPPFLNRISHKLTIQMMWQGFRSADNMARSEVLDLDPAPVFGPKNLFPRPSDLVLYGFSPVIVPKPKDWGEQTHVTGYWTERRATDWQPTPALKQFLEKGAPPIYAGFGSMTSSNPRAMIDLLGETAIKTKKRMIILAGWSGIKLDEIQENIFIIDSIPHSWLFPRVSMIIHHGGAGTTGAVLDAGKPAITVPFFGDQPYWGKRLNELGVSPKPIPRKKLSANRLARAIEEIDSSPEMGTRAAEIGKRVQQETGTANAVSLIESFVNDF